jgi:hypothetical protein
MITFDLVGALILALAAVIFCLHAVLDSDTIVLRIVYSGLSLDLFRVGVFDQKITAPTRLLFELGQ